MSPRATAPLWAGSSSLCFFYFPPRGSVIGFCFLSLFRISFIQINISKSKWKSLGCLLILPCLFLSYSRLPPLFFSKTLPLTLLRIKDLVLFSILFYDLNWCLFFSSHPSLSLSLQNDRPHLLSLNSFFLFNLQRKGGWFCHCENQLLVIWLRSISTWETEHAHPQCYICQ